MTDNLTYYFILGSEIWGTLNVPLSSEEAPAQIALKYRDEHCSGAIVLVTVRED